MKYAIDPVTSRRVSPEAHAIRKQRHGMNAICFGCKAEVFDHSVTSIQVLSHFNHVAHSGPCEYKAQPVDEVDNSDYGGDAGKLRAEFFQPDNVQRAFAVCQSMVCGVFRGDKFVPGNFTFTQFQELLHIADKKRTWALKGLTPKLMPFALVANEVFAVKPHKNARKSWDFTFLLDKPAPYSQRKSLVRNIEIDSSRPTFLVKHFINDDGFPGSRVKALDPDNPYLVSEESSVEIAGPKWQRLSPMHVKFILDEFSRH